MGHIHMRLSLNKKIMIPTLGIIIGTALVISLTCFFLSKRALDDSMNQQMQQITASTIRQIEDWIGGQQVDLEQWSIRKDYIEVLSGGKNNPKVAEAVNTDLMNKKTRYGYYEDIHLADTAGNTVCSSNPNSIGTLNVAERTYFKDAAAGKVAISDVLASKTTGNPIVVIAAPIKASGRVEGVVYSVVDLNTFSSKFIDPIKVLQTGYLYACDQYGLFIAHPDKSKILKTKLDDFDWGRAMVGKKEGTIHYLYEGVGKMVTFAKSPQLNWFVAVTVPEVELNASARALGWASAALAAGALVVGVLIAIWLSHSIASPLRNTITVLRQNMEQMSTASKHITAASQSLAEGASEQAASLEETSASLEEMASMTKNNANSAQNAKQISAESRHTAQTGAENTMLMSQSMDSMRTTGETMRQAMNDAVAANDEVAKIIKTIDEIAFQTNILALNAAVEAARAGDAGMGFAVVADEVRNLAQKSAAAAKETAERIEAAIEKNHRSMQLSDAMTDNLKTTATQASQLKQNLNAIVEKAQQVDQLVAEIATASSEQSQGISQVNKAVNEMDKVTQSNAASAEESASAAQELDHQSEQLSQAIQELVAMIDGKGGTHATLAQNEVSPTLKPKDKSSFAAKKARSTRPISNADPIEFLHR